MNRSGLSCLVVEEDFDVRRLVVRALTRAGNVVRSASRDVSSLDVDPRDIDVAYFGYPPVDGTSALARLRAATRGVPTVIATSWHPHEHASLEGHRAVILVKPFVLEGLLAAVERAVSP